MILRVPRGVARAAAISSILAVAATGVVSALAQEMEMEPLPRGGGEEEPADPSGNPTMTDASVPDASAPTTGDASTPPPSETPTEPPLTIPAADAGTAPTVQPPTGKDDGAIFGASDAFTDAEKAHPILDCPPGLYADASCEKPAVNVHEYTPAYQLWSDGADKERFVYLPDGEQINTDNPDAWSYPAGTRLYKTFMKSGTRLETRKIEKDADGRWSFETYAWFPDQLHVRLVESTKDKWLKSDHTIPAKALCTRCHQTPANDPVLGFGAIQLNAAAGARGVTLDMLNQGRLTVPIDPQRALIPGSEQAKQALGYLHANCGNCHQGRDAPYGLHLWVPVDTKTVADTGFAMDAVCVASGRTGFGLPYRVQVGASGKTNSSHSLLIHRMQSRGASVQMPPVATAIPDPQRATLLDNWIDSLPNADLPDKSCPN